MGFINDKIKNIKNAVRFFFEKGRSFSWILVTFLFISSGVGYLFLDNNRSYKAFGEEIFFPKSVITVFFQNNTGSYLVHTGYYYDAKKHGIVITKKHIKNKLESMEYFQKDKKFNSSLIKEFLKKNSMTFKELWDYCNQLCVIECYQKCWNNIKSPILNKFKKILLSNNSFNGSVTGYKLYLNDDLVQNPPENDFLVSLFIRKQILQQYNSVLTDEQRSGVVYCFPVKKSIDKTKDLSLQSPIKTYKFNNVINGHSEISDVLFSSEPVIINGMQMISSISSIKPKSIKVITLQDWNNMKKQFQEEQKRLKKIEILLEYSEKFNNGQITRQELLKVLKFEPITVTIKNTDHNSILFSATPKNKSCVFSDHNSNPSIFICDSVTQSSSSDEKFPDIISNDHLIQLQIMQWINYYIQRSYGEQK